MKKFDEGMIEKVNFKIETSDMLAYEFKTKDSIWNNEAESYVDLFRVELNKKDNSVHILVAWEEDYDVMEDLTYKFHEETILIYCKCIDLMGNDLENHTNEYNEHCDE